MAWGTACEANAILARIILEELVPKVYDLALLDELGKRSDKNLFFGRILERKWLLDNYVQAVISANKRPDQFYPDLSDALRGTGSQDTDIFQRETDSDGYTRDSVLSL